MIPTEQFRQAMMNQGLTPPEHIEAGEFYRFPGIGKSNGNKAGWCKLFPDGFGGAFGDFASGLESSWQAERDAPMTRNESKVFARQVEQAKVQRLAEEDAKHAAAKAEAIRIWDASNPATTHPYLTAKGIVAHGTRIAEDGRLVIPVRQNGELVSLQFIDASGEKRFLTGGKKKGCSFSIGENPRKSKALIICEGFATGASIHEATGLPVCVAFDSGNLLTVGEAMFDTFPNVLLIFAGDDDHLTAGNPGKTKAIEAARELGGVSVFPIFSGDRPEGATDFNDLRKAEGIEAVRRIVEAAIPATQPNQEGATAGHSDDLEGNAAPFPGETLRPCYAVLDDWAEWQGRKHRPGVYFCDKGNDSLSEDWICSPLHIDAITYDGQSNNFGRMLRFRNSLGNWRTWAMPMEMLAGDCSQLRAELLAMGAEIAPSGKARNQLTTYLQRETPKRRMRCAQQVGWSGKSFVLPDVVIGPEAAGVIFQSGERGHEEYTQAGTPEGWREGIASKASGNPMLLFGLSASFAGPLLARCDVEGGGFHGRDDSSTGKTTWLRAACSVWGGPNFKRSWRATANGMEGAAVLFNDGLLALDEISECDPHDVGKIVYMSGNGTGKQRANRSGGGRGVAHWRNIILSTGERSIEATMLEAGQHIKSGQGVRMLDIPMARKHGAWDDLHGASSAAAFSDEIKAAAAQHFGHAGRGFLEHLTRDEANFPAMLKEAKTHPAFAASSGQEDRAATRFVLAGMAGELATHYGLTGWQPGEAINAAAEIFKAWKAGRGKGNREKYQIAEAVASFIERHGDSRFSNADPSLSDPADPVRINRAGWWRESNGNREYLFNSDGMREALAGFDFKRALDALEAMGALPKPEAGGKRARFFRINKRGVKLYPINPDKLDGGEHGA